MMKMLRFARSIAFVAGLILTTGGGLLADTVKLKDGKSFDGKITFEGTDFIKLEMAVSASIKETKTILRTDIAEIVKAAPDDVALDAIRKQLPAPSMMTADGYRTQIEKGPKAFLAQFPGSRHKAEVEKILADLSTELDQVERGSIKLDGTWISPLERQQFATLTDSKIRLLSMKRRIAGGDIMGAMRDFEALEEQFFGTPAYAIALTDAKQILPALGSRLQRAFNDVDARNKKWEADKLLLDEVARAQVEGARAREVENYNRAVALEKAAGIKWLSINENSAESLKSALAIITSEINRLAPADSAVFAALGEKLVAADKMIAEGKLIEAKAAVAAASSGVTVPTPSKSTGSKSTASTSSSKSRTGPGSKTSYIAALNEKIAAAEKAIVEAKKQEESVALADKAAKMIGGAGAAVKKALTPEPPASADGTTPVAPADAATPPVDETAKAANQTDDLNALLAATATKAAPAKTVETKKAESTPKKTTKKTTSSKNSSDGDDEEDDSDEAATKAKKNATPTVADDSEGGGFSIQYVIWGVTALLVITVVVMKVTGIGMSKA